jgi:hypothetical protein
MAEWAGVRRRQEEAERRQRGGREEAERRQRGGASLWQGLRSVGLVPPL